MDDLISRQAAIDVVSGIDRHFVQYIEQLPSADAQPVRHGRWMPKFSGAFRGGAYWFDCSECGHTVTGGNLSGKHFCENCGARMGGEQDE